MIKKINKDCRDCFINTLCNGCLGLNSFHSGDPLKLSQEICEMFREMTQSVLKNYVTLIDKAEQNEKSEVPSC